MNKKGNDQTNNCVVVDLMINDQAIISTNNQSSVEDLYTTIVKEIIKYLFYMRNQIKLPYNDYEKLCQSSNNNKIPKKCITALNNCNLLFESLRLDVTNNIYQKVVIIFGNSIVSPKEIYIIDLPPLTPSNSVDHLEQQQQQQQQQTVNNIIRDIMRQLVTNQIDIFNSELKPTKIHTLIYKYQSQSNQHQEEILELETPPQTFVPNQQMEYIRKTKSTKVCIFKLNHSSINSTIDRVGVIVENNKIIVMTKDIEEEEQEQDIKDDDGMDVDMDIDDDLGDSTGESPCTPPAQSFIWCKFNKVIQFPR